MRAHHAGYGIAIAQPNAIEPNMGGLQHELLGMRGAAQKREIRRHGEFKILSGRLLFTSILSTFIHECGEGLTRCGRTGSARKLDDRALSASEAGLKNSQLIRMLEGMGGFLIELMVIIRISIRAT